MHQQDPYKSAGAKAAHRMLMKLRPRGLAAFESIHKNVETIFER